MICCTALLYSSEKRALWTRCLASPYAVKAACFSAWACPEDWRSDLWMPCPFPDYLGIGAQRQHTEGHSFWNPMRCMEAWKPIPRLVTVFLRHLHDRSHISLSLGTTVQFWSYFEKLDDFIYKGREALNTQNGLQLIKAEQRKTQFTQTMTFVFYFSKHLKENPLCKCWPKTFSAYFKITEGKDKHIDR